MKKLAMLVMSCILSANAAEWLSCTLITDSTKHSVYSASLNAIIVDGELRGKIEVWETLDALTEDISKGRTAPTYIVLKNNRVAVKKVKSSYFEITGKRNANLYAEDIDKYPYYRRLETDDFFIPLSKNELALVRTKDKYGKSCLDIFFSSL